MAVFPTTETDPAASNGRIDPLCVGVTGVGRLLDCSAKTVNRLVDVGELPKPLMLGTRRVWFVESLREYLSKRHEEAQVLGVEP